MGKARQGRGNSSGLVSLKNSGWPGAPGVVSRCLVPGPGMTQGMGNTGLVCKLEKQVAPPGFSWSV